MELAEIVSARGQTIGVYKTPSGNFFAQVGPVQLCHSDQAVVVAQVRRELEKPQAVRK